MPVQLPDDFVIARPRVEVRHGRPETLRRPAIVNRICVPIGGSCGRVEPEPAITKQIVLTSQHALGARGSMTRTIRELGADPIDELSPQSNRVACPKAAPLTNGFPLVVTGTVMVSICPVQLTGST